MDCAPRKIVDDFELSDCAIPLAKLGLDVFPVHLSECHYDKPESS